MPIDDPEILRVDMGIAIRDAGRAFCRRDFDTEERCYNRAHELQLRIWHAETLMQWRAAHAVPGGADAASPGAPRQ